MCFNLNRIRPATTLLRCIKTLSRSQYNLQYQLRFKYEWLEPKRTTKSGGDSTMDGEAKLPWSPFKPCFTFTDAQKELDLKDVNIADIVREKTERKEFFYGIETKPLDGDETACLDFHMFLPQMPEFISVVWTKRFSDAIEEATMARIPNIQMMPCLTPFIPAMPHMTVYKLTQQHLNDFLDLNLNNVLMIRGDHVEEGQEYNYCYEAVKYLRCVRSDMAIAVAGYPEGYTNLQVGPRDKELDMEYMKLKMDSGADFIVTQLCYSGDTIVEFLQDARNAGITHPIMLGILIPESFARYERMAGFSKVFLTPEQLAEVEPIKDDDAAVMNYFIQLSVRNIQQTLAADLGVYGVHFYTLNRFRPVLDIIAELRKLGIMSC
ncbi:methylenetetrahydrofolate reductase (NADPH)-like [Drosophila sulfurigaster albostrigata]|uniref:methylenetetrahydrofolate reductase (NADPH)-like n=1 Tax=Drosophila sulfurigaster albostrigata TaxID=89887 RepID=UPI002D21A9BA|nr:methylenetetrahydrofolate reductase (NADPH)-like [Drosophila sulfurigaster albostrigata]XP_062135344.1 methylenetetrahydrofolate reductase (NADPH)-like [Drosophila sulfurigaster albostrigata]XP_062135345.1 methylenetetrahydrofolate reductase (NADPH)-like [Drosophila sulfurigaster albostrigata]XP_062135346.1 methylenetetrahydrofolate reductase (NADPH)-like [Drosophila sulfurigaster albostrigata]